MALGLPYDSEDGPGLGRRGHRHPHRGRSGPVHRAGGTPRSGAAVRRTTPSAWTGVYDLHLDAARAVDAVEGQPDLNERLVAALAARAGRQMRRVGARNAELTVAAPTGTISFMMGADTTGIEPDLGLVKFKKLVGGGTLEIVNQTVPRALRRLGYDDDQVDEIVDHIAEHHTALGAPAPRPGPRGGVRLRHRRQRHLLRRATSG